MATPSPQQLRVLTSGGAGYGAESLQERMLTVASILASGSNPDGTAATPYGAYVPVGGVVAGPHFDQVSGSPAAVPVTSRLTNNAGTPIAGQIVAKPAGEGSEAIIDWSHADSTGYLFHLVDATGMTGPGLIGIGIQNGGTGLVLAKHGAGLLFSVLTDASTTGDAMTWAHIGNGNLLKVTMGQTATPGSLMVLQGWSGAPVATRIFSIQDTGGVEYGYWNSSDFSFHILNKASDTSGTGHEVNMQLGSGPQYRNYVYSGTTGLYWATYFTHSTNHLKIQSAAGAAAKGSESMNTMIDISNGNTMGFFGSAGVTQPTRVGQLTDSTGGTAGATVSNVGPLFSQTTLNNNFASLTAKINAIESRLSAAGGGLGLTA